MLRINRDFFRRHLDLLLFLPLLSGAVFLYVHNVTANPAGFYIDESSIAYNAYCIAQSGHDEHGVAWPLYFRAFGDYKNPVYIYLLAGVFRVTGPSIMVARLFSALLGVAACLVIGLLALKITKLRRVGLAVTASALMTPWLFEISRVVVEAALYPLVIAVFLLCVHLLAEKNRWGWVNAFVLASALALVTYTYTIGRVLAPLLAFGLLVFARRVTLLSILRVWALYAISLVPLLVFYRVHPEALGARFRMITYITPQTNYLEDAWEFTKHFVGNINPWKMIVSGDPNMFQIASVYGVGPVLLATFMLVLLSVFLLIRNRQFNAWWKFIVYGFVVSFVPASLTIDYFHTLRLCAVPVFLLVLTTPAFGWFLKNDTRTRNALAITAVVLSLLQASFFYRQYQRSANLPRRLQLFDADYNTVILPTAMAEAGSRPIYIAHTTPIPGYIQVFWYATVHNLPPERFILLALDATPPDGAVVISTEDTCPRCRKLLYRWPYTVYVVKGPPRVLTPLAATGFRAEIHVADYPRELHTRQTVRLKFVVKNTSTATWLSRERVAQPYQINLGNHWLDKSGNMVTNDDGRATLMQDLSPGEQVELELMLTAPKNPGEYILEVDMLQEGVSWFGLRGSPTLRLPLTVTRNLLN
jgi:4-amino-4-deoxy-L-arabinose transferase-like glycosyltransferase